MTVSFHFGSSPNHLTGRDTTLIPFVMIKETLEVRDLPIKTKSFCFSKPRLNVYALIRMFVVFCYFY